MGIYKEIIYNRSNSQSSLITELVEKKKKKKELALQGISLIVIVIPGKREVYTYKEQMLC